ncbi:site-2 protease family protein [Clostridium tetani]|uniref:site-2 protease family protein n=1 Tax=Clostridium tetani TaxID=1513 RepID=UPI0024A918EE|nr:site-2 protease family protein [Clostridium tetani]
MLKENDKNSIKKISIGKMLANILIVSLTILILGFAINFNYAVGYLFILIVHELGHYVVAKFLRLNVVFGGFTPFGAYIVHENAKNCKENATITMAGPLFGGILGLIYYIVYYITGDYTFLALSTNSIILNLANLIPLSPLDGGHIAEAISPILCYMGFPFLLYLFISAKRLKSKILLLLITVMAIYQTYNFTIKYKTDSYYKLDKNNRIKFMVIYGILVLSLAISSIYSLNTFNYKQIFESIARFK